MQRSGIFTLIGTLLLALAGHQAEAKVGWAPELERGPGAGYNAKHYDRRVAQPRSILKQTRANRAVHQERRFNKQLGSRTRANMTHRGQVAKHSRINGRYKAALQQQARKPSPSAHRATRVGSKARHAGKVRKTASVARHGNKARTAGKVARHGSKARTAGKVARHGSKLRTAGKVAGGGLVAAGAVYAAEETLGVDVPDPFEAAEWSYHTIKDPKNAGKRFNKLGRDSVREVNKGWATIQNPKKMERNIVRSANKTAKGVKKIGNKAKKLFGL